MTIYLISDWHEITACCNSREEAADMLHRIVGLREVPHDEYKMVNTRIAYSYENAPKTENAYARFRAKTLP